MSKQHKKDPEACEDGRRAKLRRKLEAFYGDHVAQDIRDVVMARDLGEERYKRKSELRVVAGDRETVRRFCRNHEELRRQWSKCASYLDNGYHALLAELNGQIVGHIWWHDHQVTGKQIHPHLVRFGLQLEPGQVWGFDLYLLPDSRGRGTSNDYFFLFRQHLRECGYAKVFGHVDAANTPAVWLHKLQGYKKVKAIEGRLYGHALLKSDGRLFLRNPPILARQKYDFRTLW